MPENQLTRGVAYVGGLKVGPDGEAVNRIDTGTVAINPGSIAATSRGTVTFTLTGAAAGDMIHMQPPATLNDDLLFVGAEVTSADTVTVYLYNPTAGAIDDVSLTWRYIWIDLT